MKKILIAPSQKLVAIMGFLFILIGAVMLPISLAMDLYTVKYLHRTSFIDFSSLLDHSELENRFELDDLIWSVTTLPLILMLVFASIVILSTVYALATGQRYKKLWIWLGLLSAAALIANFLYLRYVLADFWEITPNVGWIFAFIGAVAIGAGAMAIDTVSMKKPLLQISLPSRAIAVCFLILMTGAMMMLITMTLDWYTVHGTVHGHEYPPLDFESLTNDHTLTWLGLNWFGAALPPFLIILFASIAFFSIIYAFVTGQRFRKLWIWLSLLSVAALIANFVYLCLDDVSADYSSGIVNIYVTPRFGWILALIGALAVGIGSIAIGIVSKKKQLHSETTFLVDSSMVA